MTEAEDSLQPEEARGAVRYQTVVDLENASSSTTQLIFLAGKNKAVLEIGPATGYVTKVLGDRGCRVTAIEVDAEAAALANEYCERLIVGSVEQLDLSQHLGAEKFDCIMFGDVLEHLVDPLSVLIKVRNFLSPGGRIVASIPNIAHGSVRLALLMGRFRYTDLGLLDRTHLRFFDRFGVEKLFRDAGYVITEWRRVAVGVLGGEIEFDEDPPAHLLEAVETAPEASTYQFVVVAEPATVSAAAAKPSGEAGTTDLRPLFQLEDRARQSEAKVEELQSLIEARDAKLRERDRAFTDLDGALTDLDRAFADLNREFEMATTSHGFRALQRAAALLDRLAPAGSRRRRVVFALIRPVMRALAGS